LLTHSGGENNPWRTMLSKRIYLKQRVRVDDPVSEFHAYFVYTIKAPCRRLK
jgi:hypothetical protein